jgi:hypothetical protein
VLSRLGLGSPPTRVVGIVLVVLTVVGFLAAGVGLLADQGWWEGTAVVSAIVSLVLGLYFRLFLLLGLAIDAFVLSVVILRWPSATYVGN